MRIIRDFYDEVTAKYPALTSPARLLEEEASEPERREASLS